MKNRHGIKLITGPLSFINEPEPPQSDHFFSATVPTDVRERFRLNASRHYPTHVLYKLQNGRCFYCNEPIARHKFSLRNKHGWVKAHLFPRSQGCTLWGNKILANSTCAQRYRHEMPTPLQMAKFYRLYSPETFQAVFDAEMGEM